MRRLSRGENNLGRRPPAHPPPPEPCRGPGAAPRRDSAGTGEPPGSPSARPARPRRHPRGTYRVPALREHGSGRGGSPWQRGSGGKSPLVLRRLHTGGAEGAGAATPVGRLPSAAAGRSGARRCSVPPPRGHPPSAAPFVVAVIPGRAGGARGKRRRCA